MPPSSPFSPLSTGGSPDFAVKLRRQASLNAGLRRESQVLGMLSPQFITLNLEEPKRLYGVAKNASTTGPILAR